MNTTIIANKLNNMLLPVPERKEWKERILSYSVYCIVSCSAVANRRARSSSQIRLLGVTSGFSRRRGAKPSAPDEIIP